MEEEKKDIKKAIETLREGGVVLFPTEYGWGLGGDATKNMVIEKMLKIAGATAKNNIVVIIDNTSKLQTYLDEVPDMAWDLIDLTEKPMTIIYSSPINLAQNLLTTDTSVAIMVTTDNFAKAICSQFRNPIAFVPGIAGGKPRPVLFSEMSSTIIASVDFTVRSQQTKKIATTLPALIKLGKGNLFEIIRK